jgi:3-oxoacyl-[acyl-carrier-protein] synthase III
MTTAGAGDDGGGERRSVVFESLGVYLPERAVSTREVVAGCAVPLRIPLERLSGIRSHRVAGPGEFSVDLARAAIEDCLSRSGHRADTIDLLICTSISHYDGPERLYSFEPTTAIRLKAECGFDRALAFDVSNGCAGLWTGILLAESMIAAGLIERALVASGEFITDLIRTAQREIQSYLDPQVASLTVGDSGVAVTLEAADCDGVGLHALDLYTLARYAGLCVTKPTGEHHGGGVMLTDALRLGARSIEHMVPHLARTLGAAGWSPRDVAHLVPHQTSETTLLDGLKKINDQLDPDSFPVERYRINLADRANTATTTHFLAIHDGVSEGQIKSGDRVAFCITGSGLSIGAALYTFDDLPDRLNRSVLRKSEQAKGSEPGLTGSAGGVPREARLRLDTSVASIVAVGLVRGAEAATLDTVELCRRAGADCLQRAGCSPEDVDLVIHSGVYRTDFLPEPATAAWAAGALDLNASPLPWSDRRTLAFDLLAGHLGTLKACWTADRLMRAGRYGLVLVLASDIENNRVCSEYGLYGLEPAGSALLFARRNTGARFELFHFRDYVEHVGEFESYFANPDGRPHLVVHRQPGFAAHMARCLATSLADLSSSGLSLDRIDVVITPAGLPELNPLIEKIGIGGDRVINVPGDGDLMGSSLAAALRVLEDEGRVGPGARALILAAGAGIQTGCALVSFG